MRASGQNKRGVSAPRRRRALESGLLCASGAAGANLWAQPLRIVAAAAQPARQPRACALRSPPAPDLCLCAIPRPTLPSASRATRAAAGAGDGIRNRRAPRHTVGQAGPGQDGTQRACVPAAPGRRALGAEMQRSRQVRRTSRDMFCVLPRPMTGCDWHCDWHWEVVLGVGEASTGAPLDPPNVLPFALERRT